MRNHFTISRQSIVKYLAIVLLLPDNITAAVLRPEIDLFSMSLEQLLEIEVETLNKRPQTYLDLPAAVYVMERAAIERSGALTVPDLLVRMPGVFVKQVTKGQVAVSIRNNAEYFSTTMLVLIDGSPFYFQATGNTIWNTLPVAVEDIERIEVIRGDGGTVWGTNSTSGVVNIITRAAGSGSRAGLNTAAGTQSMGRVHGAISSDKLRLTGYVSQDKGWSDDVTTSRHGNITARYDSSFSDWKTTFSANAYNNTLEDVESTYSGELSDQSARSYHANASVSRDLGKDHVQLKFFHYNYETDIASVEVQDLRLTTSDIEARYRYHVSNSHHIHFGLNYRRYGSQLQPQPFVNQSQDKLSDWVGNFTMELDSQLDQQVKLSLGVRYERTSLLNNNDGVWSFSARGSRQLGENSVLWGNVSQSWQMPPYQSLDYLVLSGAEGADVYYQLGNPDLKAERHRSLEIGLRNLFDKALLLDMSAFYATIEDDATPDPAAVTVVQDPPLAYYFEPYTNHLRSKSWGIEMLLDWTITQAFNTQWGITHFRKKLEVQDGIDRGAVNEQYAPKWKFNLNGQYRYSAKLDVSLLLLYETTHNYTSANIYIDNGRADDHFRVDGGIHYRFTKKGKLALGFKNLFNYGTEWKLLSASAQPQEVEPSVYLNLNYAW